MPDPINKLNQFIKDASTFGADARAKYEEYRGRRNKETELWHHWNTNGRQPEHLEPLLKSIKPLVRSEASKRLPTLGGSIPRAALEAELLIAATRQIHSYDPNKGKLSTHLNQGWQRVNDFISSNRNERYLPVALTKRYDQFNNARQELEGELGRPPTVEELQEKLPWKKNVIAKMHRGFGRELYTELGDGLSINDDFARASHRDVFHMLRSDLTAEEQRFGEAWFPETGASLPTIKNVAKQLGITPERAYRLKGRLETRIGAVLRNQ